MYRSQVGHTEMLHAQVVINESGPSGTIDELKFSRTPVEQACVHHFAFQLFPDSYWLIVVRNF